MAPASQPRCASHTVSVSFRTFPERGFRLMRIIRKSVSLLLIDRTFLPGRTLKRPSLSLEMRAQCSLSWGLCMKGILVEILLSLASSDPD